jgi:cytochrome c-type biogenesis protein CcmF
MIHTTIGHVGHLSVIVAFVTALVAAFAYFRASRHSATDWQTFGRWAFAVHAVAVLSVVVSLYTIIYNHYFEYHYAWDNSSRALPTQYVISSFWQDQEGSFLLWIFWQAVLGVILVATFRRKNGATRTGKPSLEAPAMAIFALVQAFLCSMILGVIVPGLALKIGSSPFLLLREANPDWPVWQMQPNFIPEDGNGLNPLLQNYWMVIHPPTLFLGFALTLVPFAFCIAGLWRGQFREWIKPALPWTSLACLVLGVGILMGAYWAYETLNFGGYWNWDPVENAIYIPWLVLVAALHTMIIYNSNKTALRTSILLVIGMFVLVLYSTFLTRSGILGNASVHSFTDLGLSGQLLLYLFTFLTVSVGLLVWRWKGIPSDEKELSTYSREFWIFCGATVLCLAGFQVLATTSIPVYNAVLKGFGVNSTLALPADQIGHYTKFQQWFFVVVVILTGIGQYFWWGKMKAAVGSSPLTVGSKKTAVTTRGFNLNLGAWEVFSAPLAVTLVVSAVLITAAGLRQWQHIVLLTAAVFAVVTNGSVLLTLLRKKVAISGGAVTHIGVALMLLGILFSSGYSKIVSQNKSGLIIFNSKDVPTQENVDNQLLWLNAPQQLDKYLVTYRGQRIEARNVPGYLPKSAVQLLENDFRAVAREDIAANGKTYYHKGDTLEVYPENTYYAVEYREPSGRVFTLYPRVQVNPRMGNAASPSIRKEWGRDVYTHITDAPMPNQEKDWSKTESYTVALGDTLFLNDYVALFRGIQPVREVDGQPVATGDAAVQALIEVLDKGGRAVELKPMYLIKNRMVGRPPVVSDELGLRIQFANIDPKTERFTFNVNTTQRDYIVMKAVEKPLINVLWTGVLVLAVGFTMSTVRRFNEKRN